jgi:serine/threonine protein kinase
MATARCTKCGSENPKEALFCTACGQALHHAQNDPLVGQTIGGRYHLVERIGQGAAGTIYRAEHTTLRRRMAVKLLHQQLAQNEDAVERFRREAITVCEIDNDHIPQVFDFGRAEDGRLFFAMEFLDGVPLSVALEKENRLTPERAADILAQIGDGLMEAHTLGYIHRDLRPRSIFLTRRRGRADFVKILDFGLAKLVQPELTDAQRTAMGMTYGDPRYMAPEQARGEVVDRRADIYSLGVLGYEMVCGEPPFKGNGTFDVLSKLLEAPVPRLRDKRPGLSTVAGVGHSDGAGQKAGGAVPDRGAVPRCDGTKERAGQSAAAADAGCAGSQGRCDEEADADERAS